MAKKRVTLPKNFEELIEISDINELKRVFEKCEWNATGGYAKGTALGFYNIPEELTCWLVRQGAEIEAPDIYGRTPLHQQAMKRKGKIDVLLELGADITAIDKYGETPLHMAAGSAFNPDMVQTLLQKGANVAALNSYKQTPLLRSLKRANSMDIENLAKISQILLETGAEITLEMQEEVRRIGNNFEFHRDGFNKEYLNATETGLDQLYQLFKVPPVKRREIHNGISLIRVTACSWEDQYEELWQLLVPSSGAAKTIQGEVIRISGKVRDEIYLNGGTNWGMDYKKMLEALMVHFSSGVPLCNEYLTEVRHISKAINLAGEGEFDELSRLCELAVIWVKGNPNPVFLEKTEYCQ